MVVIINLILKIKNFINIKNFRLRLISTLILFLIFLIFFLIGNPVLPIFLIIVFLAVLYEFNLVCGNEISVINLIKIFIFPTLLFTFVISEIYNISPLITDYSNYFLFLLIALMINIIFFINYKKPLKFIMSNLLVISFFSLINLLLIPNGLNIFLYLVLLVSTMDIFAYIGGNIFGAHKIAPNISHGKTIEGTVIGLSCTMLLSIFAKGLIDLSILQSLILGFSVGLFAFLGDLLESLFKRNIGIKDSGKLIPGHGGLLDRFDGYILILPLFNITLIY